MRLLILILLGTCLFAAEEDTPLAQSMQELNRSYKALSRALREPDSARQSEYLELIQRMQLAALAGKVETPVRIAKLPEAERATALAAYRTDMAVTLQAMLELEKQVIANDYAAATQSLATLKEQKSDGHDKYQEDE